MNTIKATTPLTTPAGGANDQKKAKEIVKLGSTLASNGFEKLS